MVKFRLNERNINRLVVLLVLLAPLIYLFGSLFFGLNGAHGQPVFANTSSSYILDDDLSKAGDYKFIFDDEITLSRQVSFTYPFKSNGNEYQNLGFYTSSQQGFYDNVTVWRNTSGFTLVGYQTIYFNIEDMSNTPILQRLNGLGHFYYFENGATQNNEYIFGQFFSTDNWLKKIGDDIFDNSVAGFQPFADLIRFVDVNVFNIASTGWGSLLYGYSYYSLHVVSIDLVVYILLFIPRIFKKVLHTLEGGLKND